MESGGGMRTGREGLTGGVRRRRRDGEGWMWNGEGRRAGRMGGWRSRRARKVGMEGWVGGEGMTAETRRGWVGGALKLPCDYITPRQTAGQPQIWVE